MSLEKGFQWEYGGWHFVGYSLAGITTSIVCKNASACFDVGQGLPFQMSSKYILLTHAHLDHAAGLPYIIAQKNMAGQKGVKVYCPKTLEEPLRKIMELWQTVDGYSYDYHLAGIKVNDEIALDPPFFMKPFQTKHRVDSQGYLIYQEKRVLRDEFSSISPSEIKKIPHKVNIYRLEREPMVAFTGDTEAEFWKNDPDLVRAKILFMEVTFWDEKRSVAHAREWGHIHFEEFLEILPKLKNERIVLIHTSIRYSFNFLQDLLKRKLPVDDLNRVVIFPRIN
jgi:ribonuclease Z